MADNALARALMLNQSPAQQKTTGLPLYGALSDTGGGAPSIAQQLARALLNVPTAISEAFKGNSYGSADPNNAIADAARQQFWRGSVFGVPEDVTQRNLQRATNIALAAPTVYHGSPHKFDAFDSSKIGTGEGAQAYGHGLYFAENPGVAQAYKDQLSPRTIKNDSAAGSVSNWADWATKSADDATDALRKIDDLAARSASDPAPKGFKSWGDFAEAAKRETQSRFGGSLYTVDLPDAMAAKMLDWDKPLSQQHPDVQAALKAIDHPVINAWATNGTWPHATGEQAYRLLAGGITRGAVEDGIPQTASTKLRDLGIPGIRYLDQGSRGAAMQQAEKVTGLDGSTMWIVNGPKGDITFDTQSAANAFIQKNRQGQTYNYVAFPGTEGALKILERK